MLVGVIPSPVLELPPVDAEDGTMAVLQVTLLSLNASTGLTAGLAGSNRLDGNYVSVGGTVSLSTVGQVAALTVSPNPWKYLKAQFTSTAGFCVFNADLTLSRR